MPGTLHPPANALSAVDYFKAKLQFENTPAGLHELLGKKSVLVLDVRDRPSYEKEHIRGAVNIPLDELPFGLRNLPKGKTIVIYSWNIVCHLAPKAALELAHRDYKVQELVGGIEAWKESGFPIEGKKLAERQEQRWENEGGTPA